MEPVPKTALALYLDMETELSTSEGRRLVLVEVPAGTIALLALLALVLGTSRSEALAGLLRQALGGDR